MNLFPNHNSPPTLLPLDNFSHSHPSFGKTLIMLSPHALILSCVSLGLMMTSFLHIRSPHTVFYLFHHPFTLEMVLCTPHSSLQQSSHDLEIYGTYGHGLTLCHPLTWNSFHQRHVTGSYPSCPIFADSLCSLVWNASEEQRWWHCSILAQDLVSQFVVGTLSTHRNYVAP
jgi:hypothetical protein